MKCTLCDVEWNEIDEPDFFQSHISSKIHMLNSKHHDERIKSRKERHERMRKKNFQIENLQNRRFL